MRLRRAWLIVCALACVWAAAIAWTGGIILEIGPLRFSSRNVRNPLVLAVLSAAAVWVISASAIMRGTLADEWAWWHRHARRVVGVMRKVILWARPVASPWAIAFAAVALDVYQWTAGASLWLDEEMIALNVRDRTFAELGGSLWLGQSAPWAWLVLQRVVFLTAGTGEVAVRLVPFLFGVATIGAAVWIGRRWMGKLAASVLVLLCAAGVWVSHYRFEVKHYTADAFFALLLPALAIWALEGEPSVRRRRLVVWWGTAAIAQLCANGALFVTPACVVLMFAMLWLREGTRAAWIHTALGVVWLAAFAVNYQLSLGGAHTSSYLRSYWANRFPPPHAGLGETVRWLATQVPALAENPGGTTAWHALWVCAAIGFVLSIPRRLGCIFGLVPLSAFALSALRIMPAYERMALWIAPALYVGLALLVDRAVQLAVAPSRQRRISRLAVASLLLGPTLWVCADIVLRARADIVSRPRDYKHSLDDRTAVRWLGRQRQPGDALLATRLTWPAIWWYGNVPVADNAAIASVQPDGVRLYELQHLRDPRDCRERGLRRVLSGHRRALVYLGFRDERPAFYDLLVQELNALGTVTGVREISSLSRVAIIDLQHPVTSDRPLAIAPDTRDGIAPPAADGCVALAPASRW